MICGTEFWLKIFEELSCFAFLRHHLFFPFLAHSVSEFAAFAAFECSLQVRHAVEVAAVAADLCSEVWYFVAVVFRCLLLALHVAEVAAEAVD